MIPGVVLAFGDRTQECDKFNITITEERTDVAEIYGGKFEMTFDLIAFSKDSEDREKLSDYIVMSILDRQSRLGFEGIELLNISPGGENEDVFNAETDEYFYESSIAVTFRVDWQIYHPLPVSIWRGEFTSREEEQAKGHLDGTYTYDLLKPTSQEYSILEIGKGLTFDRLV